LEGAPSTATSPSTAADKRIFRRRPGIVTKLEIIEMNNISMLTGEIKTSLLMHRRI
jgi:hypothetical protein